MLEFIGAPASQIKSAEAVDVKLTFLAKNIEVLIEQPVSKCFGSRPGSARTIVPALEFLSI